MTKVTIILSYALPLRTSSHLSPRVRTSSDARAIRTNEPNDPALAGSDVALKSLLHAKAHQALLYAISRMSPITEPRLRIAFARALKAVGTAVADAVGPSWWALGPDTIPGRDAARVALEECLNVSPIRATLW